MLRKEAATLTPHCQSPLFMPCISGLHYTRIATGKSGTERLEISGDKEEENCSPQCCLVATVALLLATVLFNIK